MLSQTSLTLAGVTRGPTPAALGQASVSAAQGSATEAASVRGGLDSASEAMTGARASVSEARASVTGEGRTEGAETWAVGGMVPHQAPEAALMMKTRAGAASGTEMVHAMAFETAQVSSTWQLAYSSRETLCLVLCFIVCSCLEVSELQPALHDQLHTAVQVLAGAAARMQDRAWMSHGAGEVRDPHPGAQHPHLPAMQAPPKSAPASSWPPALLLLLLKLLTSLEQPQLPPPR